MRGSWLGRYFMDYFPMKVVKGFDGDLDPSRNYLIANHPHGYMCAGVQGVFGSDASNFSQLFPGIKTTPLTLQEMFGAPGLREISLGSGGAAVTNENIDLLLSDKAGGNAAVVVPGEVLQTRFQEKIEPSNILFSRRSKRGSFYTGRSD